MAEDKSQANQIKSFTEFKTMFLAILLNNSEMEGTRRQSTGPGYGLWQSGAFGSDF